MMLDKKTRKELWDESTLEESQFCDYCSPLPVKYFDSNVENDVWISVKSELDFLNNILKRLTLYARSNLIKTHFEFNALIREPIENRIKELEGKKE